jgi:hypothetical protein
MEHLNIHPIFRWLTLMVLSIGMLILVYSAHLILISMPLTVYLNMLGWLALAILAAYFIKKKQVVIGYLTSLFCMLIAWRLSALYNMDRVSDTLFAAFIIYLMSFISCAYHNVRDALLEEHRIPLAEWQLIFIRLYIGFNFVPAYI